MLGQLFQGIIPGLGNHFEIPGLLPTKDGADTTKEIADDIAGSDAVGQAMAVQVCVQKLRGQG